MNRILIIENSFDITGAFNSILRSSISLRNKFHFIFLIPTGSRCKKILEQNGFVTIELPMLELRKNLFTLLLYFPVLAINAFRLKRILRVHQIGLVVNNDFYNLLPPATKILGCRVPYVCYVRFMPDRFPSFLLKIWSAVHDRWSAAWVVVSQAVRNKLVARNTVEVIPNEYPIELPALAHQQSRVLLFPANYTEGKGQNYAIESFARVARQYPAWKLRFVGGDLGMAKNVAYKKSLIELADALQVSSQVEFSGFSSNMRAEYVGAAIVLMFSESESFSMVCVEAMHSECPVIATRCGGPEEIIDHETTGFLVPRGDVDRMAETMKILIDNPAMRKQIGMNAAKAVLEKFGREKTVKKLEELYLRTLEAVAKQ